MNSPSISRAHSWNSIWKCLLTQTSLFQSSFVQAEMCSFLILCQRKIRIKLAHTLSSSKVVHYWKRSFFILLHKLVLANLMYWCCYFKHGIGLSYFRKKRPLSWTRCFTGKGISIDCWRCDWWHPVLPDNICGKNSPRILVRSELFGIAAHTRSVGVFGCLGSLSLGTDWSISDSFYLMLCCMSEIFHCINWADGQSGTTLDDWDYFLKQLPLVLCTLTWFAQEWCLDDLSV